MTAWPFFAHTPIYPHLLMRFSGYFRLRTYYALPRGTPKAKC